MSNRSDTTLSQEESAAIAALNAPGKRIRVHDAQMVIKLPHAVKRLVKEASISNDVSEATVVRWALADYFEKRGL